jgi:hypothetical protein
MNSGLTAGDENESLAKEEGRKGKDGEFPSREGPSTAEGVEGGVVRGVLVRHRPRRRSDLRLTHLLTYSLTHRPAFSEQSP